MSMGAYSQGQVVCLFRVCHVRVVGLFLRSWSVGAGVGWPFGISLLVYKDGSEEFYGFMQCHRTSLDESSCLGWFLLPNKMRCHCLSVCKVYSGSY
jgi:hypothetical protein